MHEEKIFSTARLVKFFCRRIFALRPACSQYRRASALNFTFCPQYRWRAFAAFTSHYALDDDAETNVDTPRLGASANIGVGFRLTPRAAAYTIAESMSSFNTPAGYYRARSRQK